jgi:hypothetical protein
LSRRREIFFVGQLRRNLRKTGLAACHAVLVKRIPGMRLFRKFSGCRRTIAVPGKAVARMAHTARLSLVRDDQVIGRVLDSAARRDGSGGRRPGQVT